MYSRFGNKPNRQASLYFAYEYEEKENTLSECKNGGK